jgi:cysteinyl-tRNA synthetase
MLLSEVERQTPFLTPTSLLSLYKIIISQGRPILSRGIILLRLYNSLSKKKEVFVPLRKGRVRIYTCGPTVHDYAHLGNFRTFVFYDVLRRWLKYRGYKVKQVLNITDVDEKTLERAKRKRVPLEEIAREYEKAFFEDLKTLNIEMPEFTPRATENVPEMAVMAKVLLERGYAFRTEDGAVYFDVTKSRNYGRLSGKVPRKNLRAKSLREDYDTPKHFGLWKPEEKCEPGVCWGTVLGKGSPGWHLECSAMALKYLGETIDISAGGEDLLFPHHENTLALTEAYTGKECAHFWLHTKHLTVEGGKMSKSLRNYYTLRDILKEGHTPEGVRVFLLSRHYRKGQDLTFRKLKTAEVRARALEEYYTSLKENSTPGPVDKGIVKYARDMLGSFEEAMDDDLNVEAALRVLWRFIRETRPGKMTGKTAREVRKVMDRIDSVLGIMGGH